MRIAVTGASGFVGKHIIAALQRRDHDVVALRREQLDLSLRPVPTGTLSGFEVVIHAAAHLPASYSDPTEAQRCMDINALGTLAVLEECAQSGVQHVIHLSTNLYRFSEKTVAEDAAFEPAAQASYYLVSKAAADFFAMHATSRLPVAVLRLGSVYGPGMARGAVATFADRLRRGDTINVEDGGFQSDLVDVRDVAAAVLATVERRVTGAINIGSGVGSRPLDIATHLVAAIGTPASTMHVTPADKMPRGFATLDIARATRLLDFTPRELKVGLNELVSQWRVAQ